VFNTAWVAIIKSEFILASQVRIEGMHFDYGSRKKRNCLKSLSLLNTENSYITLKNMVTLVVEEPLRHERRSV
jgi:hypothetical protein